LGLGRLLGDHRGVTVVLVLPDGVVVVVAPPLAGAPDWLPVPKPAGTWVRNMRPVSDTLSCAGPAAAGAVVGAAGAAAAAVPAVTLSVSMTMILGRLSSRFMKSRTWE